MESTTEQLVYEAAWELRIDDAHPRAGTYGAFRAVVVALAELTEMAGPQRAIPTSRVRRYANALLHRRYKRLGMREIRATLHQLVREGSALQVRAGDDQESWWRATR